MTATVTAARCVICGKPATQALSPKRSTISRGPDPEDPSFSLTGVLPDISLCDLHNGQVADKEVVVGWCDEEECRRWGAVGESSPCGKPYAAV